MTNLQGLYEQRAKCAEYESEAQYALNLCEHVGFLSWLPRLLLGRLKKKRAEIQREIDEAIAMMKAKSDEQ